MVTDYEVTRTSKTATDVRAPRPPRTRRAIGFVDVHTHILPGLDDGPETEAQAIELCRLLAAEGVTHAVAFMPAGLIDSLAELGCVSHPVDTAPPTPETLRMRESMCGYFSDQSTRAVFFDLREIEAVVESWGASS